MLGVYQPRPALEKSHVTAVETMALATSRASDAVESIHCHSQTSRFSGLSSLRKIGRATTWIGPTKQYDLVSHVHPLHLHTHAHSLFIRVTTPMCLQRTGAIGLFNRALAQRVMTAEARCSYASTNPNDESSHSDKQLSFLVENGVMDLNHGPMHIKAALHVPGMDYVDQAHTKVVHFQRHGQAYHNLIYGILNDAKAPVPDVYLNDVTVNPFLRTEMIDSPLTELGREQCRARKEQASNLSPEVIIVSPLSRAVQTALITFDSFRGCVPFVAHDGCREELGLLTCNKRKPLSEIIRDYPDVDFSVVAAGAHEEDNHWIPDRRECPKEQSKRIYRFLVDFIQNRPEKELAVVGHSAWLFSMCHTVLHFGEDGEEIKDWFKTGEIRSLQLTFSDKET